MLIFLTHKGACVYNTHMKIAYNERIHRTLISVAICFFLASFSFLLQFFFPKYVGFDSMAGVPYLVFSFFSLCEGTMNIRFAHKLKKGNIDVVSFCKRLARYELAISPLFTITVLFLSIVFPKGIDTWLSFVNLGFTFSLIVFKFLIAKRLNKLMHEGLTGYVAFRNHAWISGSFLVVIFNFYLFSNFKVLGSDINLITKNGFGGLSDTYLIISVAQILFGVLILIQSLAMSIFTYYSGVENDVFDFKINLEKSIVLFFKYDIPFWISIFSTGVMLVIALISSFRLFEAYFALVLLYVIILAIKIPSFFKKRKIENRYHNNPYLTFVKKHELLIYCSILLILYGIACAIFGGKMFDGTLSPEATQFTAFGVFVPWAVFKVFFGGKSYALARKRGEPTNLVYAYIDILVAIFTLAKTLLIISSTIHNESLRMASWIIGISASIYCLYVSIMVFVLGIRGLSGKRKDYYLKHAGVFGINNLVSTADTVSEEKDNN